MTRAHFEDGMNLIFKAVAARKQRTMAGALRSRREQNAAKMGERGRRGWGAWGVKPLMVAVPQRNLLIPLESALILRPCSLAVSTEAEVEKVVAAAAAAQVTDMPAALAELVAYETGPDERASLGEKYVEAREQEASLDAISTNGASLLLLDSGSASLQLNHKSADIAGRKRLADKLRRLATKLNMPLGGRWARDSALYQAGLEQVRKRAIARYQEAVEMQVFKRKLLLQRLARAESGNNASHLRKNLEAVNG
jgi:hypothetical protein